MKGFDLSREMADLVRSQGDEVAISEPPCVLWKAEHENCKGCSYELGCSKVVHLMLVMMTPMMYKPRDYDDFAKMEERIQELVDKTLKAKSPEELHALPSH